MEPERSLLTLLVGRLLMLPPASWRSPLPQQIHPLILQLPDSPDMTISSNVMGHGSLQLIWSGMGSRNPGESDMSALSVRAAAAEAGDRPALISGDLSWTWAQLAAEVEAEIESLSDANVQPVVLDAVTEPATVIRILALLESEIPFALLHPGLTPNERARRLNVLDVDAGPDAMAILFTSGSSGLPRAVELTRDEFEDSATASAARLGWQDDDRWLCCLPIAHVGGLSILTRCLIARRTIVLVPRFEPAAVIDAIDRHAVTLTSLVPTMLDRLLRHAPHWTPPSSLRAVLLGGSPCSEALWDEAERREIPVRATYGLTETCSQVATARAAAPRDLVPLDGINIRVENGCIEVGGFYVYSCTHRSDGFIRTGDLGRLRPDGVLEVLGRADDLIVTGGENVMPAEVETELENHPQIARAAVFGQPDPEWGEIVVAALVADGAQPSSAAVRQWCDDRLASFRRPRRIAWLETMPENATGKIDRKSVIEMVAGRLTEL